MAGYAAEPTVTTRRNAPRFNKRWMYALSFGDKPDYLANWEPFNNGEQLRERLIGLGITVDRANDAIDGLDKRDLVKLSVDAVALKKERVIARTESFRGAKYDCNCCSWKVLMVPDNNTLARQYFSGHVCAENPPLK